LERVRVSSAPDPVKRRQVCPWVKRQKEVQNAAPIPREAVHVKMHRGVNHEIPRLTSPETVDAAFFVTALEYKGDVGCRVAV